MSDIEHLEQEIFSALEAASTEQELEAVRVAVLGKKGSISERLKKLGSMSIDERHKVGPVLNGLKKRVLELLAQKRDTLKRQETALRLSREVVDVTLPVRPSPVERGRIHPISQVIDEIVAIYAGMGFSVAEGPDIETDYYNFTALNFPENHPAREMHDTFFFGEDVTGNRKLLRTHTSPVQIRVMEKRQAPIRIIIPGKTYRMDSDATHSPMFHQVEGLVIDKTSNIAHMMWLHETFCKIFFEVSSVKMRFRPSFFPFTEPSMEVDIQCDHSSSGIKFGEGQDWLEILGCGMVHPHVLKNVGFDPDEYQGFAWGMGIDRVAMLKYGMPDLRAFFDADLRWLDHYGFRCFDISAFLRI
ncbi:phenylalanine--tRNA ligase subunit alpha [Bartonella ancashensis]|uniref:Phenylalanine--tRNA ligase alpha subunit n=1 Tax=Bartonella ancashensis TaxID=1318743 RepID=A0A0M4L7R4_9HYPH|nr:phenylalanine--tRNA ligase subunit alpha [Bartonella ancashensis]ALE03338.1 Phenylalanyl-tRNA synthetase alpha chain [Bartonella ancashensis]